MRNVDDYMAIDWDGAEFDGDVFLSEPNAAGKPSVGRPMETDPTALVVRRRILFSLFDRYWSDLVQKLQRVKTASGLRTALAHMRAENELASQLRISSFEPSVPELRRRRKQLHALYVRRNDAVQVEHVAREYLATLIQGAFPSRGDERLEKAIAQRERQSALAAQDVQRFNDEIALLEVELKDREAGIWQAQLLEFLLSKRYAITPANIASAMAGVPYVTWRQSVLRSSKVNDRLGEGISYSLLKELIQAFTITPRSAEKATEQLKTYLLNDRRQSRYAVLKLREDWYYLRSSVYGVYRASPPRKDIPYLIHREYCLMSATPSAYDRAMHQEDRL